MHNGFCEEFFLIKFLFRYRKNFTFKTHQYLVLGSIKINFCHEYLVNK